MADPISLLTTAYALVEGDAAPQIGDVVTIALRGNIALEIAATVIEREISDDGEHAILLDDTGCRWALPIRPLPERSAA